MQEPWTSFFLGLFGYFAESWGSLSEGSIWVYACGKIHRIAKETSDIKPTLHCPDEEDGGLSSVHAPSFLRPPFSLLMPGWWVKGKSCTLTLQCILEAPLWGSQPWPYSRVPREPTCVIWLILLGDWVCIRVFMKSEGCSVCVWVCDGKSLNVCSHAGCMLNQPSHEPVLYRFLHCRNVLSNTYN